MKMYKNNRGYSKSTSKWILLFCKPRMLLLLALAFSWETLNGPQASASHTKNLRLRAPSGYAEGTKQIGFSELRGADKGVFNFSTRDELPVVGPFVGNAAEEPTEPRKKKDCGGMPSIATRGLLGPTLKRSYFAFTPEEVEEKRREEQNERKKREVKRNDITESPLPWTCETKYEWTDMGADHYPRFVRTAECKTRSCFNGFFRCKPRRYKTKVLKGISPTDSTSCEEDDVSLPETLRSSWRFITVTINLCCDCVGRIPGGGAES